MDIDRRDFLTGLATTAAAAILPAQAGRAAAGMVPADLRRFTFVDGPIFSPPPWNPDAPRRQRKAIYSVWHFDPRDDCYFDPSCDDRFCLIKHLDTGLLCRSRPLMTDGQALQALSIDRPFECLDAEALDDIGMDARFVAYGAALNRYIRHHEGAIYFWYSKTARADGSHELFTEDAPPLAV